MKVSSNKYTVPVNRNEDVLAVSNIRSHKGAFRHAWDFPLKENVPILVAKEGVVVEAKDDSTQGGNDKKYAKEQYQNKTIIEHNNKEYTEYYHLAPHSALVKEGDIVKSGQVIAKGVGMIGYTTQPHLHFMVFKKVNNNEHGIESVKVNWEDNLIIEEEQGEKYVILTFKRQ